MDLVNALMSDGMIRVKEAATDWRAAVKLGVGCLVAGGKAKWEYYYSILNSVSKNGPYFVLMPGVALPHARPDEGVLEPGLSLVTLSTPVNFGDWENDPISILLSFCATDAASQLEDSLAQAVTLFEDEANVEKLLRATTVAQIEKIIRSICQKKTIKKPSLSERWRLFWGRSARSGEHAGR